jgi:hypothetical protein
MGGPVSAGGAYLVGERGPEILQMGGSGGNVVPNHKLGGGNTTINVQTMMTARQVAEQQARYDKRNGRG